MNTTENFRGLRARDGILILASSGIIQDVNLTACDLMGFEKKELLGASIEYFFVEALFFIRGDWDKSKANSICFEKSLFGINRQTIYAEINIYCLDNDKIFVIIKDNSELKKVNEQNERIFEDLKFNKDLLEEQSAELVQLSQQLSESEERLKELIIEKDKFFSIVAHDIKSPFNGLMGLSSIICEEFDSIEKEKMKQYLFHMDSSIKNQYRLIENLLNWSRLQSGKMICHPVMIGILGITDSVLGLLSQNAMNKSITIINNIKENVFVSADEIMLNSVIENLIANGIKFTNYGGKITIDSISQIDMISISIKDSGVGMDSQSLQDIFRIDVSHSTLGTEKEKGTGLGLVLCKEMLEKQGGTIEVNSQLGIGTEVIIKLPIWKETEIIPEPDSKIEMVI